MIHIPWIWSSQNSVCCLLIGMFIRSSVLPSLQHMFTQCLMCSAMNKAGHVSPLMQPPHIQERQNQQQQQRQCKGKCSQVVISLEKQKSGKGIESGVGGEWYFILGRATAESGPCKTYRGGAGGVAFGASHTVSSSGSRLSVCTGLVCFPQAMLSTPWRERQYLFCLPDILLTLKSEFLVNSV